MPGPSALKFQVSWLAMTARAMLAARAARAGLKYPPKKSANALRADFF